MGNEKIYIKNGDSTNNACNAYSIFTTKSILDFECNFSSKGFVDISFRVVLSIVLMVISGGHHSADLQELKSTKTSDEEKKFARVDIVTLYPMYILSILVLFISNKIIIILIVFTYFLIHIIPVPYRYKLFKTRVE